MEARAWQFADCNRLAGRPWLATYAVPAFSNSPGLSCRMRSCAEPMAAWTISSVRSTATSGSTAPAACNLQLGSQALCTTRTVERSHHCSFAAGHDAAPFLIHPSRRASRDTVFVCFHTAQLRPAVHPGRYEPLKAEAAGLRQELAALQKRVVAEELKARGLHVSNYCFASWVPGLWQGQLSSLPLCPFEHLLLNAHHEPADLQPLSPPSSTHPPTPPHPCVQAHKAASEAQAARQELAAAQQHCQDYKAALVEAQAGLAAAREAEQRLQQQLAGEQRRVEKVGAGWEFWFYRVWSMPF